MGENPSMRESRWDGDASWTRGINASSCVVVRDHFNGAYGGLGAWLTGVGISKSSEEKELSALCFMATRACARSCGVEAYACMIGG